MSFGNFEDWPLPYQHEARPGSMFLTDDELTSGVIRPRTHRRLQCLLTLVHEDANELRGRLSSLGFSDAEILQDDDLSMAAVNALCEKALYMFPMPSMPAPPLLKQSNKEYLVTAAENEIFVQAYPPEDGNARRSPC